MPRGVRKTTYQNLMGQIDKLRKQADAVRGTEMKSVIEKIKQQMNQYNISASDLGGASGTGTGKRRGRPRKAEAATKATTQATAASARKNKAHTRRKAEVKFRDPVSGATWSGRGRTPKWISAAKGKTKQDFAIA